jgi:hypothetical protein
MCSSKVGSLAPGQTLKDLLLCTTSLSQKIRHRMHHHQQRFGKNKIHSYPQVEQPQQSQQDAC